MTRQPPTCPCRCTRCGLISAPRPRGTTPAGWKRGEHKPGDSEQGRYWCPHCAEVQVAR